MTRGKHDPYWDQWWVPAEDRPITINPLVVPIRISQETFEAGSRGGDLAADFAAKAMRQIKREPPVEPLADLRAHLGRVRGYHCTGTSNEEGRRGVPADGARRVYATPERPDRRANADGPGRAGGAER